MLFFNKLRDKGIKSFMLSFLISSVAFNTAYGFASKDLTPLYQKDGVEGRFHTSIFLYAITDPYLVSLKDGFVEYASTTDINYAIYDASNSMTKQISQVRQSVTRFGSKNHVLVIDAVAPDNAEHFVRIAKRANMPVIFYHSIPHHVVIDSYDKAYFVGTDVESAGQVQADILNAYFRYAEDYDKNDNGAIDIIYFKGKVKAQEVPIREKTFLDRMRTLGYKVNVLYSDYCNWDLEIARASMVKAISKVGIENIDAVVSQNDAMAIGALEVLQNHDFNVFTNSDKYIPIVGVDGIAKMLNLIDKGEIIGTAYNDNKLLTKVCFQIANALVNDIKVSDKLLGIKLQGRNAYIPFAPYIDSKINSMRMDALLKHHEDNL